GTTHDGPGMRTTVFVKGCPLHCTWCQNPESIAAENDIWWSARDCIGCLSCVNVCPAGALRCESDGMHIDRAICEKCGACAETCPSSAMSWQGKEYDLESLVSEVLRLRHYYEEFGGGVTCSGGEPLLQSEFVAEFFKRMHEAHITTALDTCGCVSRERLDRVLPFTDYVLYDVKLFDSDEHKKYTGAANGLILDNLLHAADYIRNSARPAELWIRTPLIPGFTATPDNIRAIGTFLKNELGDVLTRWELCAFNGICVSKYEKLGIKWQFDGQGAMSETETAPLREAALSRIPPEKLLITGMIRQG
ncbi:MAG: glycyl-radical enzyme activating protein, partial [Clostridia bacterium]|nr:glycyl-radical enzyme activating protein [Clostridia bacterium]